MEARSQSLADRGYRSSWCIYGGARHLYRQCSAPSYCRKSWGQRRREYLGIDVLTCLQCCCLDNGWLGGKHYWTEALFSAVPDYLYCQLFLVRDCAYTAHTSAVSRHSGGWWWRSPAD